MNILKFVDDILMLHSNSIVKWNEDGISLFNKDFLGLVEENHKYNYQLWHAEDRARRDDMGYEFVYHAKRAIDAFNQQRNNKMEEIDKWIYIKLAVANLKDCPAHSETPGMMIDRLSILALKHYYMTEQGNRSDASSEHRFNCLKKADLIALQKEQLAKCLADLLQEVKDNERTFRVYYQFKMYNDPNLNPELQKSLST